jgi:hypothetical protein
MRSKKKKESGHQKSQKTRVIEKESVDSEIKVHIRESDLENS